MSEFKKWNNESKDSTYEIYLENTTWKITGTDDIIEPEIAISSKFVNKYKDTKYFKQYIMNLEVYDVIREVRELVEEKLIDSTDDMRKAFEKYGLGIDESMIDRKNKFIMVINKLFTIKMRYERLRFGIKFVDFEFYSDKVFPDIKIEEVISRIEHIEKIEYEQRMHKVRDTNDEISIILSDTNIDETDFKDAIKKIVSLIGSDGFVDRYINNKRS